jgi:hypothetical protein
VTPLIRLLVVVFVALAAGCGGHRVAPSTGSRSSGATSEKNRVRTPRQHRQLERLRADVRRLEIVAAPVHHSLMGTPKLLAATGRFLDDEARASLDNPTKNHMVDLAASAVAGSCDQCFQQLEASRPIAGSMKTH